MFCQIHRPKIASLRIGKHCIVKKNEHRPPTIGSNGFTMVFGPTTVGPDGFSMVFIGSEPLQCIGQTMEW